MNSSNNSDLITVGTYWDPLEAQIARLRLAHEGIPVFLEKEFTVQMAWHFTNALGGIRLAVPAPRHNEALALLTTKELFSDWGPTRCWEWSLNGIPVITEEEELAAARDLDFKVPLTPREELAERALRAAILGLRWEIPLLFACAHLWRFYRTDGRCRPAFEAKARWAFRMSALIATAFVVLVVMFWLLETMPIVTQSEQRRDDPLINAVLP